MNGLIVVGGEIDDKFACDIVKTGAFEVIFAADSGIDFMYRNHITPDIVVGDFDSANPEALEYYRDMDQVSVVELQPEKDDTDTEHTIRAAIRLGCDEITVLGGFGTRMDHTIANISLLGIGLEYGVDICFMDAKNRVRMIREGITLEKSEQFGTYISLIAYAGTVHDLTISGMKYNLDRVDLDFATSLGISNEIVEEKATIDFRDGTLLVIEAKD